MVASSGSRLLLPDAVGTLVARLFPLATVVTLGLLACWVALALAARHWRAVVPVFGACVAAVSLVAVAQMTSHVSQIATVQAQAVNVPVGTSGVRPGEQVAVASDLGWQAWVPLAY